MANRSGLKHAVIKALSRLERDRDLPWARLVATAAPSLRLEAMIPAIDRDLKEGQRARRLHAENWPRTRSRHKAYPRSPSDVFGTV